MDKESIAIVTATFYKNPSEGEDKVRSTLAKEFISKTKEEGYSLIIVDGGSPEDLVQEFKGLGANVYSQQNPGMDESRREVFSRAFDSGAECIIWIEPEKIDVLNHIPSFIKPIENGADLVIPKRKSMETYPKTQQETEGEINNSWFEVTKKPYDICFGPRVIPRKSMDYFTSGDYSNGWARLFVPVINMVKDNKKIEIVETDYIHPESQTKFEEENSEFYDDKRVQQLEGLRKIIKDSWESD